MYLNIHKKLGIQTRGILMAITHVGTNYVYAKNFSR